jgi:hypothetical protein
LFLLINPGGSKLWRWRYRFGRREKLMALGEYPVVSLASQSSTQCLHSLRRDALPRSSAGVVAIAHSLRCRKSGPSILPARSTCHRASRRCATPSMLLSAPTRARIVSSFRFREGFCRLRRRILTKKYL